MSSASPTPQRRRLSVCMIARDEAAVLAESLDSVCEIADEIVVVDTGSRDATAAIARDFGAVLIEIAWNDDFSQARNAAIEAATCDWVLWLDAGETLPRELAAPLREFVDQHAQPSTAYLLTIESLAPSVDRSLEAIDRLRLMPRRDGLRFTGRVLESLRPALATLCMTTERLACRLVRGERELYRGLREMRARRNLRLLDLDIGERGESYASIVAKAEALASLGQMSEAVRLYRAAIDGAPRGSREMLEAYYGLLAALDRPGAPNEAQLSICLDALAVFPLDAQLLCAMGGYLQAHDQLALAERSFRLAVEHGVIEHEIWHRTDVHDVALACLVLCLELQNRSAEAAGLLEEACRRTDVSPRIVRLHLNACVRQGRTDEALRQSERLALPPSENSRLRTAIRGACLAARNNFSAAMSYLQTAYSSGCRDVICLRWLTAALFALGEPRAAEPILAEWARIEPGNGELQVYQRAIAEPEAADRRDVAAPLPSGQTLRVDPMQDAIAPARPTPAEAARTLAP